MGRGGSNSLWPPDITVITCRRKQPLSCREQLLAQRVKHVVHAIACTTCLKQIGRSKDYWVVAIDYIALEQP